MRVVVDTSILIDHLRGGTIWKAIVKKMEKDTEFFIPSIVFFELFSGISTKDLYIAAKIDKLTANFQRIDLSEEVAKNAGKIYRDISITLEVPDYIIAASALTIGGVVVTLNKRHFEHIPNLSLYPL